MSSFDADDLPVACALGPEDAAARHRRRRALGAGSAPRARRLRNRLEVRWRLAIDDAALLDELVAAERECCPFLSWSVSRDGSDSVLRIVANPAGPDDIAAIAALFDAG